MTQHLVAYARLISKMKNAVKAILEYFFQMPSLHVIWSN